MRRWIPLCVLAALGLLAMGSALSATTPADLPDCGEVLQTPVPAPAEEPGLLLEEDEAVEMAPPGSGFTFEGCFTFFPAGPCRDVFRDDSGTLWICKACGTTKKPPNGCSVLTGSGFWCS